MIYRRATPDDNLASLLDALMELASGEDPFWYAGAGSTESFVVADDEGKLAGLLGTAPLPEGYWYAAPLYVAPAWRGNGVAKGLMREAARLMAATGRTHAITTASPDTLALYEGLGFSEIAKTMRWTHA